MSYPNLMVLSFSCTIYFSTISINSNKLTVLGWISYPNLRNGFEYFYRFLAQSIFEPLQFF